MVGQNLNKKSNFEEGFVEVNCPQQLCSVDLNNTDNTDWIMLIFWHPVYVKVGGSMYSTLFPVTETLFIEVSITFANNPRKNSSIPDV